MAIAFELVADFGGDRRLAEEFLNWFASRLAPIRVDQFDISLHYPILSGYPYSSPNRFQVSILPENVGCNVAMDRGDRLQLTDSQLSILGDRLYGLLRGAPHFELAMVGWDVDYLLDVEELNAGYSAEIRDGTFVGLVVKMGLISKLPFSPHFEPFDSEHLWIPYRGSKAI